jgi:hypothetical protein
MARRNRGLGAVFLRADGRWEGQIRIGGGRRRSFYARTRRDLVHKLSDARWALGEGLPVSAGTQSLRIFLEYWLMGVPHAVAAYHPGHLCPRCPSPDRRSWRHSAAQSDAGVDPVGLQRAARPGLFKENRGEDPCRPAPRYGPGDALGADSSQSHRVGQSASSGEAGDDGVNRLPIWTATPPDRRQSLVSALGFCSGPAV